MSYPLPITSGSVTVSPWSLPALVTAVRVRCAPTHTTTGLRGIFRLLVLAGLASGVRDWVFNITISEHVGSSRRLHGI